MIKNKNKFKKRLYSWTLNIIRLTDTLPDLLSADVIGKQLMRSGTSIIANYVEAKSASSRKDYINFFTHALKSANESKVWLTMMKDLEIGNREQTCVLLRELDEISKILASSIITLKNKGDKNL
ncbi:MAG: four helix bundle protein [Candidatus Paceibacterota bacterium]|jgi:four helix bundle protein